VTGSTGDEVGLSVSAGDVDNDGVTDTLVGAPQFTDGAPGYVAVFSGGPAPDLELTLKPRSAQVQIPPTGGKLFYQLRLVNQGDVTHTVDVWVVVTGPGTRHLLTRFPVTLAPHTDFLRVFTQTIPGGLAPGTYSIIGSAGLFPDPQVTDSFIFTKL
jgi:hypothetical protein